MFHSIRTCTLNKPDWHYVLREFYNAYRYGSAGGSSEIRHHQRAVQKRNSRCIVTNLEISDLTPTIKPVCAPLARAGDNGEKGRTQPFTCAISKVSNRLVWSYGYNKVPRSIEKKYAYAELLDSRAPVVCEDLILGLVLFASKCSYPAHSHEDIAESYLCLIGMVSENHDGVYRRVL